MGAIVYDEFQTTPANFAADVATFVNTSTDWAVLTPWYEEITTISAAEAVGQTLLSASSSTTTSGLAGESVVIDRGTAEEETLTVSSWNAGTVTMSTATAFAHDVGSKIERLHPHTVKAVTAAGTQLVLDLQNMGAASNARQSIAAYRQHDGTTGVDRLSGHISWVSTAMAGSTVSNTPVHVVVAAGPDFLWLSTEGPRTGEPYAENNGPSRQSFFLGTIVPYDDADTSEPVIATVDIDANLTHGPEIYISRNAANTLSWVVGALASVTPVNYEGVSAAISKLSVNAVRDGTRFFWPYLVCEEVDGPRGRLKRLFYAGPDGFRDVAGQKWTLDGLTFLTTPATDSPVSSVFSPFQIFSNAATVRALVLVPIAGTPA